MKLDPAGKIAVIRRYAHVYPFKTFVETGTATGDTPAALMGLFNRVFTVEMDPYVYRAAVRRFADQPKVTPIHGPSDLILRELLRVLDRPIVYWLDAHDDEPSDEPLWSEVDEILWIGQPAVILMDDADWLPEGTIDRLLERIEADELSWKFEVKDDIIRVTPT